MSSALSITPAVMINRKVHEGAQPGNHLLQVALLRANVTAAAQQEQARTALLQPEAATRPASVITGADVDRLV